MSHPLSPLYINIVDIYIFYHDCRYIPFLLIIMVKSVFEHGTGIIVCCGLVLTFLHANSVLKQQVRI